MILIVFIHTISFILKAIPRLSVRNIKRWQPDAYLRPLSCSRFEKRTSTEGLVRELEFLALRLKPEYVNGPLVTLTRRRAREARGQREQRPRRAPIHLPPPVCNNRTQSITTPSY